MKEDLLKIINFYGVENQLKYIHSEYFELDEAIIDYWHEECGYYEQVENYHKKHIGEEIADVEMMLDQFKAYYDISQEKINEIKLYKIARQLKRIEVEKNERKQL